MGKRKALLIGVTKYGAGFNYLEAPERDVEMLKKALEDQDIGDFQVTSHTDINSDEIRRAIESHFCSCQNDDTVLFYFSGHGHREIGGDFYLLSKDSCKNDQGGLTISTAVDAPFIHKIIKNCASQQQIIILDCCNSGAFENSKGGTINSDDSDIGKKLQGEGRAVLTSSRFFEPSYQSKQESKLSVYTRHLIEGLQTGEADQNGDTYITVDELHVKNKTCPIRKSSGNICQF